MDIREVAAVSRSGDGSVLVKGKRMKRTRPPSPLWSSGGGAASSSSSAGDFSPPSSSGKVYESTEEDEDLAHCLILLAQGGPRRRRLSHEVSESRRSSKKFTELVAGTVNSSASGGGVARAGFYVYECRTCSRVFPSFQALGGHRASHKRPKTAVTEDVKKSPATPDNSHEYDDDEGQQLSQFRAVSPLCNSLPIAPNKLPKIHECSICGSEFSSGQALGGHMRRHRALVCPSGTQVTVLGLESLASDHHHEEEEKTRDVLSLDLNLPAPPEEDPRESKFQLVRRPLVLSSPSLIDCHY